MKRECSGCAIPEMKLQREKKFRSLHSYIKRSMPKTLFGTLRNLIQSVQKHLSVRTLYYTESSQKICNPKQLGRFKTVDISSESYIQTEINPFLVMFHLLTNQYLCGVPPQLAMQGKCFIYRCLNCQKTQSLGFIYEFYQTHSVSLGTDLPLPPENYNPAVSSVPPGTENLLKSPQTDKKP